MAGRRWDASWDRYPASKPLTAEGGIATRRQRGQMADTWWSKRFIDVLESYGLGARMQRGRRYARAGQVLSLDVEPGLIAAQVQGSRRTPYVVTIQTSQPSEVQWRKLDDAFRSRIGFVARLLAGELPPELEDVFADTGVQLFPTRWSELRARCNCPDSENPCKHIAAVLYVFADQLDTDPWLALAWRGRDREQLLAALQPGSGADATAAPLPAWWPLRPGLSLVTSIPRSVPDATPADPADRILTRLEPLDAAVGQTPVVELLRPVYEVLCPEPAPEPL